jgi:hypothetical protein
MARNQEAHRVAAHRHADLLGGVPFPSQRARSP